MPDAFVNVTVKPGSTVPVDDLTEVTGVDAVHEVRGTYQAVVELVLDDSNDLQEIVTGSIQQVPEVADTDTVISPALAEHHRPTEGPVTGPFVEE